MIHRQEKKYALNVHKNCDGHLGHTLKFLRIILEYQIHSHWL
jgi:hypothetical protein